MKIVTTIAGLPRRDFLRRRVLVPTMGALHKAHGELIRIAREHAGLKGEVAVMGMLTYLEVRNMDLARAQVEGPLSAEDEKTLDELGI